MIDVGCGQGFFTLPAARLVGDEGKIYAIDSNEEALRGIKDKAATAGLTNTICIVDEAESAVPRLDCADIVFIGIALHDFRDPTRVLANARIMLKPGGRQVNLDWKKQVTPFGPPIEKRFDEKKAAGLITRAGFSAEATGESGPYHYLITALPPHP